MKQRLYLPVFIVLGLVQLWLGFASCWPKVMTPATIENQLRLPEQPNILWLVAEDLGPYLSAFGDSTVRTPHLDRLAAEGVRYPRLFSTSGVCAPSRAAIATGMYPSSIGANHMRTTSDMETTGLPKYEAVPGAEVRMLSEQLRAAGYFCTNNYKQDYQFKAPRTAWDQNSPFAHWRNRAPEQPFFAVFNFNETHESGLFEPYGFRRSEARHYRAGDTSFAMSPGRLPETKTAVHLPMDTKFPIPPYLPNTETVRRDLWKTYNNIAEMDAQVGAILEQLEEDGLLDKTVIFFYGDHGGPLPRQKRLIYDSGLNTPMIVRFPQQQRAGTSDEQLISFVDFAPTLLSLSGTPLPDHLQGQAFLGKYKASKKREFIFAAADRFDAVTDAIRAVRDHRFKYIRNYRPEQGYYLPVEYRERIPTMQVLLQQYAAGTLTEAQGLWFREHKDPEELYDCASDPHELHNLAADPAYQQRLSKLRQALDGWLVEIGDQPNLPERELIQQLWGGASVQPQTAAPSVVASSGKVSISCSTAGASMGYQVHTDGQAAPTAWTVYQEAFAVASSSEVLVQAHRLGYLASDIVLVRVTDDE